MLRTAKRELPPWGGDRMQTTHPATCLAPDFTFHEITSVLLESPAKKTITLVKQAKDTI